MYTYKSYVELRLFDLAYDVKKAFKERFLSIIILMKKYKSSGDRNEKECNGI